MIRTLLNYLTKEVLPRWRTIALTSEFVLACLTAGLISYWGPGALNGKPTVNEFVTAVAAYAAIAMGFCVAGMTIALTLPSQNLMERLATRQIKGLHGNALSALLFVFSWTALVHWIAVLMMLVALVIGGSDQPLVSANATPARRVLVGCICGFVLYCLFQFAITIITISQVGEVYIDELKKAVASKAPTHKD